MRKISGVVLLALAWPAPANADPLEAGWAKVQPARAVYVLRQRGEGTGDAAAISGRMVVEAKLTCTEFATTMTMEIRATSGAQTMTAAIEQQSTETRDGKVYRFSARTTENGRETERREGQAVLQSRDGPGEAKVKGSSVEDVKLEAGTVLPGTHLLRMLAAAAESKTALEYRVFYGLDQMKIVNTKVTIGPAGRSGKEKGLGEFADKPGWTFREEHKEVSGQPDSTTQTVETFMTEDAVTTRILMAIQGLELVGTPITIEKLAKPECKS
jgi:hypothetical protein